MDVVQARLGDGVCVLPLQTKNKVKHQFVCEIGNTFFASFWHDIPKAFEYQLLGASLFDAMPIV